MNCQEFQTTLDTVARAALIDAGVRREAEEHTATCRQCAVVLADALSLTSCLRELVTLTSGAEASANLEASLLAAFRSRSATGANSLKSTSVTNEVTRLSWTRMFGYAGLAAAAAVALVMLVPPMFQQSQSSGSNGVTASVHKATTSSEQSSSATTKEPEPATADPGLEQRPENKVTSRAPSRTGPMASTRYAGNRVAASRPTATSLSNDSQREIATDFIPIAHAGGFVTGEGGQVIRVELPRSALTRFGLPLNADRADGRVKADVLLSEDGVAREMGVTNCSTARLADWTRA